MNYIPKCGDIFLCDSNRTSANIVKFFMTAPTWYQYIWRAIRRTQEEVRYYHAGMILGETFMIETKDGIQKGDMVEQQSKVQLGETEKILSRKIIIYRNKKLTDQQRFDLGEAARTDIGEGYGILSILGKTLTWLTGITLFVDLMHLGDADICVNRIAYWYWKSNGKLFGVKNFRRTTTETMDKYCLNHPEEWEIVYQN